MPVVFVGAAGRMTSGSLEAMASEIADNLKVILLERCGHWISEEQPDALAATISELAEATR